ncbi:response regulator transcription factor [Sphingomonas morindae]|uniref:Response regulator transcription factor n=1 Tax=Sphingomonas morindae TaxID=1541170 RepID=A0ABY4X469_9SPHN|nr:response regulator transcription factor [Sphingomonas morindae]USI71697.1 response regulator transcription factor [Sphingomonas morindae]
MSSPRLLIADDHPLVVEALAMAVRACIPGVVVDSAGSIAEAERLGRERRGYRLVLLDLMLPDARGFSGFLRLKQALPQVPIVIVTAHAAPDLVETAKSLGAAGFLNKAQPLDQMSAAIRTIHSGTAVFPTLSARRDTGAAAAKARIADLSDAQMRVLLALADGRLNKQIAGDLGITEATVKAHLTAIFRKLGVNNRTQALLAMQPLLGASVGEAEGEQL